jgi:catechol 2,3-dioxygenase-like lactoylglutathione lyase family enzyme
VPEKFPKRPARKRAPERSEGEGVCVAIELDHIILAVNERARSVAFYAEVVGLAHEGEDGPFSTLRVTPGFVILLSASGTAGGDHLAFAMSRDEFDAALARIRYAGIPYGDAFDTVGENSGPGDETGSRGIGKAVYFYDPDRHLLEFRYYEEAAS